MKENCWCCNQKRVLTIWNKKALCKRCLFNLNLFTKEIFEDIEDQMFDEEQDDDEVYFTQHFVERKRWNKLKQKHQEESRQTALVDLSERGVNIVSTSKTTKLFATGENLYSKDLVGWANTKTSGGKMKQTTRIFKLLSVFSGVRVTGGQNDLIIKIPFSKEGILKKIQVWKELKKKHQKEK